MTVTECSLMSCVWARFQRGFPHYAWVVAVSPLQLCWVKGVCVLRCNLPPALLAEWPGLLHATAVTRGWNGHQIRVSTQSRLWRSKFSCWDSNSQPFNHKSGAQNQMASYPSSLVMPQPQMLPGKIHFPPAQQKEGELGLGLDVNMHSCKGGYAIVDAGSAYVAISLIAATFLFQ